jgi:hypothetical protein
MAWPAGWDEITRRSPDVGIRAALNLLNATFPKRYPHLTVARVRDKLEFDRSDAADGHAGPPLAALRLFRHTTNNVVDIVSFFFLRFVRDPRAHCLSPGVAVGVTAATLYAELVAICRALQQEQSANGGVATIDILSHKLDIVADLDETPNAIVVAGAFQLAEEQLFFRDKFEPGRGWPSELYRWEGTPL